MVYRSFGYSTSQGNLYYETYFNWINLTAFRNLRKSRFLIIDIIANIFNHN
ncbi:hypothetical protein LfeInf_040 [Lactobacillus phage LfeInf]|uniref:Uncharacterized protein n=1 Tax=Lactobacillus phage LfeInf TaxID=1567484 RepID=A0A0A7NNK4_9CAUD|nr:hypothetical protein AXJ15_gp122 [Lactobacillus phage LfeInf]AIZ94666.1 hypothetical protein LfeInf_040 [Lactobacillus phage LfeInf]